MFRLRTSIDMYSWIADRKNHLANSTRLSGTGVLLSLHLKCSFPNSFLSHHIKGFCAVLMRIRRFRHLKKCLYPLTDYSLMSRIKYKVTNWFYRTSGMLRRHYRMSKLRMFCIFELAHSHRIGYCLVDMINATNTRQVY